MSWASVSAITRVDELRYTADIDPRWTVAGKANGGYLLGTAARAAADASGRADVLSASAVYLHAPRSERVEIVVEVLRSGRSVSHVRARIVQDDVVCVEALYMTTDLAAGSEVYWDGGLPAVEVAPMDSCERLPPVALDGTPLDVMGQNDLRLDPAWAGFLRRAPTGTGELRGWLGLGDGETFDSYSLLYAVDSMPPATFELRPTGWVPTLELTAYVRAVPSPGPLKVMQRAQLVADNRVDEVCMVWDATGRLVAQATQLAGVRLG